MSKTTTVKAMNNIYQSIAAILAETGVIGKNKRNQQQNFQYRGIDDIYNELQPLFAKHKVFITSEVLEISREERQTKQGGALLYTILKVKFTFYAEDGSNVNSIVTGEAMDTADKGANKALSIALKYCLMQLLLIRTEDLSDADGTTHEVEPQAGAAPVNDAPALPWLNLNTADFTNAVRKVAAGAITIDGVRKFYRLSRAVSNELETQSNALKNVKQPA